MNFKNIFLLLLATLFLSCEESQTMIETDNLLIGNWVEPIFDGEITTYKRAESLPNEAYGISFDQQNFFTERTSGWCGTPPLSFFNIEGTFELENSLIHISKESFPTNYTWRIVSLTETELVVKRELSEQEIDHKNLMELFSDIENIAYSISCSNSNEWLFAAYGAKACGGPQGYIPYSNQIDVNDFLQKIAIYTQAEKDYNHKHGIVSDCSVPVAPTSVECINGFPTLKY